MKPLLVTNNFYGDVRVGFVIQCLYSANKSTVTVIVTAPTNRCTLTVAQLRTFTTCPNEPFPITSRISYRYAK